MAAIGPVNDPMSFRLKGLQEVGVKFVDKNKGKRVVWSGDAGYEQGVVLSGDLKKGEALKLYINEIAHKTPEQVIFVDDGLNNLQSVQKLCEELNIPFTGFHYEAKAFEGKVADPDVARLQFKVLSEKGQWLQDEEAKSRLKETGAGEERL